MVTLGVVCCSDIVCVPLVPQLQLLAIGQPCVQEVVAKSDQVPINHWVASAWGVRQAIIPDNSDMIGWQQQGGHEDAEPNDGPQQTGA